MKIYTRGNRLHNYLHKLQTHLHKSNHHNALNLNTSTYINSKQYTWYRDVVTFEIQNIILYLYSYTVDKKSLKNHVF